MPAGVTPTPPALSASVVTDASASPPPTSVVSTEAGSTIIPLEVSPLVEFPAPGEASTVLPDLSKQQLSPKLTSSLGISAPPEKISPQSMFLDADPVVQAVMIMLLLASLITWGIILEKFFLLRRASRSIMLFKKEVHEANEIIAPQHYPDLVRTTVSAGLIESQDYSGHEARHEYRERVERAMRMEVAGLMDRLGYRTLFLATVGAVSPFVGLFGTVWGIMNSFMGIATSGETTLAVVAPGIAEALFATAMGLVAAIPAVIAYNKITGTLKKITKETLAAIGYLGNRLTREHFQEMEKGGGHGNQRTN